MPPTKTAKTSKRAATSATTTPANASGPKKTAARKRARAQPPKEVRINALQRHRMIEVAAYYLAQQRGFQGNDPQQDWYLAEQQIDAVLETSRIRVS